MQRNTSGSNDVGSSGTSVIVHVDDRGVAELILNRPDANNALNGALIRELSETLSALSDKTHVRVVIVAASGKAFSAGADTAVLTSANVEGIRQDARAFASLLRMFRAVRQPIVAVVQGPALGGGAGLVACCDIAIASTRARFAFPEVTLGLAPAIVCPYIVGAIGARQARRYLLTGESFDAQTALQLGFVHAVVPPHDLADEKARFVDALLEGGPQAVPYTKAMLNVDHGQVDDARVDGTVERFCDVVFSAEGREGVAALLGSREPHWRATAGPVECA